MQRAQLPIRAPAELATQRFLEIMALDKKVQHHKIRLVLLRAIGTAVITADFEADMLKATIERLRDKAA